MNPRTFVLLLGLCCQLQGQGFVNLNFESAILNPIVVSGVPYVQFSAAYPGWSGQQPAYLVLYNSLYIGSSGLAIIDSNYVNPPAIGHGVTAVLQGGVGSEIALFQTGLVPADTMSLRFYAASSRNTFAVSLNGNPLGVSILQDFGIYKEYGVNIPPYAGQIAELRFTQLQGAQFGNLFLDDIVFSPIAVPEPGTWALFGLGSALFWCAARRRRN